MLLGALPVLMLGAVACAAGGVSQEAVLSDEVPACRPGGSGKAAPVATTTVLRACPTAEEDERAQEAGSRWAGPASGSKQGEGTGGPL